MERGYRSRARRKMEEEKKRKLEEEQRKQDCDAPDLIVH